MNGKQKDKLLNEISEDTDEIIEDIDETKMEIKQGTKKTIKWIFLAQAIYFVVDKVIMRIFIKLLS